MGGGGDGSGGLAMAAAEGSARDWGAGLVVDWEAAVLVDMAASGVRRRPRRRAWWRGSGGPGGRAEVGEVWAAREGVVSEVVSVVVRWAEPLVEAKAGAVKEQAVRAAVVEQVAEGWDSAADLASLAGGGGGGCGWTCGGDDGGGDGGRDGDREGLEAALVVVVGLGMVEGEGVVG